MSDDDYFNKRVNIEVERRLDRTTELRRIMAELAINSFGKNGALDSEALYYHANKIQVILDNAMRIHTDGIYPEHQWNVSPGKGRTNIFRCERCGKTFTRVYDRGVDPFSDEDEEEGPCSPKKGSP